MKNIRLDKTRNTRIKAIDAKYHALEIVLSLECYYWTDDDFHYCEALSHYESFVSEMAKLQTEHKKVDNI